MNMMKPESPAASAVDSAAGTAPIVTHGAAVVGEPAPEDALAATREALLTTYRELLAQIRTVAGDPRQTDELARLAEAAGRLVHGGFVQRLVFGADH